MMLQHVLGMLTNPRREWKELREEPSGSIVEVFIRYLLVLALIPPVSLLIGTTTVGWSITGADPVQLPIETAVALALMFYLLLLLGVVLMAYAMHWMEATFGASADYERCLVFTIFTSVPMFLSGLAGLYPQLWFGVGVVLLAAAYSVYLLYTGVPVFMEIPPERGFVFSTAMLTAGLCALVGCLLITVVLWGPGLATILH